MTACMRGLVSLVLLAHVASACVAQSPNVDARVAWLRDHAAEVRTLNLHDDFSDLEPLAKAIGDARLVLLGEAAHHDGATILAKGRLVRFLHERMGFDVLAMEAGFYDGIKAGEDLAAGTPWRGAVGPVMFLWSHTRQFVPVMEYVQATQKTARPIALAGMSWYVIHDSEFFDDVVAFFEAADPELPTDEQRRALAIVKRFLNRDKDGFPKECTIPPEVTQIDALIDLIKRDPAGKLGRKHGDRRMGLMRTALENLRGFYLFWHAPLPMGGTGDNPLMEQEGRNVRFLAEDCYPGRKMIVWAHSGHLARATNQIEESEPKFKYNETVTTGQRAYEAFGDNVYSIMFTAYGGRINRFGVKEEDLSAPPDGSLEDLLHRTGMKLAFIDFRHVPADHWLRSPLTARPVAYNPMRADWTRVFDGIFFIDTMIPSAPELSDR